MKIILIFGPQAVGKMTIGEKVGTAFNLPLLHNHVTLDAIWRTSAGTRIRSDCQIRSVWRFLSI